MPVVLKQGVLKTFSLKSMMASGNCRKALEKQEGERGVIYGVMVIKSQHLLLLLKDMKQKLFWMMFVDI